MHTDGQNRLQPPTCLLGAEAASITAEATVEAAAATAVETTTAAAAVEPATATAAVATAVDKRESALTLGGQRIMTCTRSGGGCGIR